MSTLAEQVSAQMKEAMRAKDKQRLNVLRALKTALTNAAIEKGGLGTELDESESLAVMRKQVKQREDSARQFREANRGELAENEEAELAILQKFMPTPLSEEEVDTIVTTAIAEVGATSKAQMGQVMKLVQEKSAGRADGKTLAQKVAEKLG